MKITKDYVRIYLKTGYWETDVLRNFMRGSVGEEHLNIPAYFWCDNCEYEPISNCYRIRLPLLNNKEVKEDVYIPREFVLLVCVRENKALPAEEMGRVGFQVPTEDEVT